MTQFVPSTGTTNEIKEALFPEMMHTELGNHAVQFLLDEGKASNIDINTLRRFILFLKTRQYN